MQCRFCTLLLTYYFALEGVGFLCSVCAPDGSYCAMHTSPSTYIFTQSTTLRVGEPPYAHLTTRPPAHAPRRPFSTLRPQRPLGRWTRVGRHPCVVCRHVDRVDIRTNRLVGSITIRRVRPPSSRFVWVKRTTLALPVWGESHQIVLLARCRVRSFRLDHILPSSILYRYIMLGVS
jgi:hypothetical protein